MRLKRIKGKVLQAEGKLPLEKFIPAAFLIFLLSIIILSLFTYNSIDRYYSQISKIRLEENTIKNNFDLRTSLSQLTILRREFISKGDNKTLDAYNNERRKFKQEHLNFLKLPTEDADLSRLVFTLDSLQSEAVMLLDISIENHSSNKDADAEQEAMQDSITSGIAGVLSHINKVSSEIANQTENSLNEKYTDLEKTTVSIRTFIVVTSIFSFVVLGLSLLISNKLIKNKNKAEQLLIKSYDELEERVKERTKELSEVNKNLKDEISIRERTEVNLRESEKRFRMLADSAPVMIWMTDTKGSYNYFNKVWLNYTGKEYDEEAGQKWMDGIHPDDFENYKDNFCKAFENRKNFQIEYRLKSKENGYEWILGRGVPRFKDNEFIGYIGSCVNIDNRKKKEQYLNIEYIISKTLSESENLKDFSKELLEIICTEISWDFAIFWIADTDKNLLNVENVWSSSVPESRRFIDMVDTSFSLSKGEGLPGKAWKDMKPVWVENIEDTNYFVRAEAVKEINLQSAFAIPVKRSSKILAVMEFFNKKRQPAEDDLVEVLNSVAQQAASFLERRNAEQKLSNYYSDLETEVQKRTKDLADTLTKLIKETEKKEEAQSQIKLFAHAIKDISECVYITDLEHNTKYINGAFEKIYGYKESDLIGKALPILDKKHVPSKKRDEIIGSTLRGSWKGALLTTRKDGTPFHVYLSTSVVKNDEGKVEAIVGICQDITEMKDAEELLLRKNSLLKLLNDIILFTNRTFDLKQAIQYSIDKVCEYTKWDVGHCYLESNGRLESARIWNTSIENKYEHLREVSEKLHFSKGEGNPGKTFTAGKSSWLLIEKIKNEKEDLKRIKVVRKSNLKTVIWVPIINRNETTGVLEFFKTGAEEPDTQVMKCLANIGIELGSICERQAILNKVKQREVHFKAVADTAYDGIVTLKNDGEIVYINKSIEKIFGYTQEEILNMNISILIPEIKNPDHLESLARTFETNESKLTDNAIELTGIKKDSSEMFLEFSLAKWETNKELFFTGMVKDITERKKIEKELLENQQILMHAQEIAKLGSWDWNRKENTLTWSEGLYSVYETNPNEFSPSFDKYLDLMPSADKDKVKSVFDEVFTEKKPFNFFHKLNTGNGKVKTIKVQGEVYLDDSGNVEGIFGTGLDVTEIKEAEERLVQSEKKLRDAQEELIQSEKLAALGRFSSGIAHEIRNPLANIRGLAQIVSKEEHDEDLKKHLSYILKNVDIANKIIKDLLNYASPEELELREENIKDIIDSLIESIEPICKENNIEIRKSIPSSLPHITCDRLKIENAFMNFLSNSIQAMPGGGEITIAVSENKSDNSLKIIFSDTGEGIPQENLTKIFEPFFTTKDEGTGLGMSLAYQSITLHKGFITIESATGEGTTIITKLPLKNNSR